ncbi:hypothetical protein GCM10023185_21680 [Hymenobacter saemangeumensis]|uniref:Uncharacterized protein n=1 Tax=Hymenobacter saemangeumensis TaxID=1084522 RepID=A0ABP8IED1_9BACT
MARNQAQGADPQPTDPSEENNRVDGASTRMIEDAIHGQTLDPERDGQRDEDQQDDSMHPEIPSVGPARASDENLPRELTKPSDNNFTLPEMREE